MILFFRKIRRTLMEKNKVTSYLLYSMGEVALVVVGILIAVQIDDWNERRIQRTQEKLYLQRLIAENQTDIQSINTLINEAKKGMQTIDNFCMALNDETIGDRLVIQYAVEYLEYGSIVPIFKSSSATFEDLSSTGNLTVIRNDSLRSAIIAHYAEIEHVKDRMTINTDWAITLDGPFYYGNDFMRLASNTKHLFPHKSEAAIVKELRENRIKYINNAASGYWVDQDAVYHLGDLLEKATSLIERLQAELENQ